MTSASGSNKPVQGIDRRRLVLGLIYLPVYFTLFMLLPAGTWTWSKGWLFVLVILFVISGAFIILLRVNPEVIFARTRIHEGTEYWDKVLLFFYFPAMLAIGPVAALDDSRFHWFPVSWWVCGIGYALLLTGIGIVTWAEGVNKFFEVTVRIQTDRGHRVIDSGPYAIARHPGYVGAILTAIGMALSLGSLWALIPAVIASIVLIVRTRWEDQMLHERLNGYREYAGRVRYKLLPGVW